MIGTDVVIAGVALALSAAIGLVVHESAHALVLRLARVDFTLSYFPCRTDGPLGRLASCPWAVVEPMPTGQESPWVLRLAALAPLLLAVPVLAVGVRDGLPADAPIATAIAIGWLACAIPSPQDFSVAFYAHRLLDETIDTAESNATISPSRAD